MRRWFVGPGVRQEEPRQSAAPETFMGGVVPLPNRKGPPIARRAVTGAVNQSISTLLRTAEMPQAFVLSHFLHADRAHFTRKCSRAAQRFAQPSSFM